jgi:hypothetical protein
LTGGRGVTGMLVRNTTFFCDIAVSSIFFPARLFSRLSPPDAAVSKRRLISPRGGPPA